MVLYTDVDVLFVQPMTASAVWRALQPFSANAEAAVLYSAESTRDAVPRNTGVMFINIPRFERMWPELLTFGRSHNFSFQAYDQGWINAFFAEKPEQRAYLNELWNWKVYWGGGTAMRPPLLVHFHGPKPGRAQFLDCLASRNESCLDSLPADHPYIPLCAMGFRADRGRFANATLSYYSCLFEGSAAVLPCVPCGSDEENEQVPRLAAAAEGSSRCSAPPPGDPTPACVPHPKHCRGLCAQVGSFVQKQRDGVSDGRGWSWYYDAVAQYATCMNARVWVEVGAAWGALSRHMLRHATTIQEYHVVDPFRGGYDKDDPTAVCLGRRQPIGR